MTSKLHGVCHSKGGPRRLHLREGQCRDFTSADGVLKDVPPAAAVMGDQGYGSDKVRKMLARRGIPPCIPPCRCRKKPVHYSKRLDRKRHKIETLFSLVKDCRRLATRYDHCAHVFCSVSWPPLSWSGDQSRPWEGKGHGAPSTGATGALH